MTIHYVAIVLLGWLVQAQAQELGHVPAVAPEPWPESAEVPAQFVDTPPRKLPRGLRFEQITADGKAPHTVGLLWIDLNQDGRRELVVDTYEGGSAGGFLRIFAKSEAGFREIAGWQGGFALMAAANGYYQIESWSRSEDDQFNRALFRFEGGRYECVRLERWVTKPGEDEPEFFMKMDPKKFGKAAPASADRPR